VQSDARGERRGRRLIPSAAKSFPSKKRAALGRPAVAEWRQTYVAIGRHVLTNTSFRDPSLASGALPKSSSCSRPSCSSSRSRLAASRQQAPQYMMKPLEPAVEPRDGSRSSSGQRGLGFLHAGFQGFGTGVQLAEQVSDLADGQVV
jgi:hypothetical protein